MTECSNIYPNLSATPLSPAPLNAIPIGATPLSDQQQFRLNKINEILLPALASH